MSWLSPIVASWVPRLDAKRAKRELSFSPRAAHVSKRILRLGGMAIAKHGHDMTIASLTRRKIETKHKEHEGRKG